MEVTYYDEGTMKFSHNYNLRNFPFDKQKLIENAKKYNNEYGSYLMSIIND